MPFELLRAAAAVSSGGPVAGLPPGMLRLSLEYAQPANVAVERARIADLLGANGFDLQALAEDDTILILQFPGVLRKQSATFLFREADSLVDALGLVSATPDVDPGWIGADELGRDAPESVPGLVAAICESNAPKPHDPLWAVKAVRADQAWAAHGASGAGILVGQPDTGVATHDELVGGVDIAKGVNILTGGGPPIDPLTHAGNPGHGTATSSCVTSRTAGLIAGTAPGAMIVPVRCVNLVVLSSGAAVAAAIDHARNQGCHVITMSLGGPVPFPDLRNAIRRAVKAGMIVLAAAGNCVGLVVYPAWDDDVIAVAGVDEHDRRWKGSSHGSAVDISAPAENVFVARRSTPTDLNLGMVHPGQGTSFAVAITAGVAALWLSRFGVAAVRNQANSHGLTTQTLFRAAVRKTARRPAGWPTDMGAGVVDALALLDLPLDQIFPPPSPPAGPGVPPAGGPLSSPSHHPLRQTLGPNFDWARFGAEAGFLALDRAQREQATRQAALESPVAPRPSPGLVAALRAVELEVTSVLGAPAVVTSPLTPALSPRQAIRIVASSGLVRSGGVENAG
ncbi:S8 family peptidase, partial [Phenylobacterium sp.]|uniref:S8 family peptidase n=1 Tax=Phenylobacterium sp. TaxID=1871053 RepID=UPI0037C6E683